MRLRTSLAFLACLAAFAGLCPGGSTESDGPDYPSKADKQERRKLDELDKQIDGFAVYTRKGHVWKVTIGDWSAKDLGKGDFARIAPDGKHIAVLDGDTVYAMNADGSERKKLTDGARKSRNCPLEFHANSREIIYGTKNGFRAVDIKSRKSRDMNLPGKYAEEPSISADGKKLAARWGKDLYAVDIPAGKHRKFARGCSSNVSPDGKHLLNNNGGHRTVTIQSWDGKKKQKLDNRSMKPDRQWDNHHWSNHVDYFCAQGERGPVEAYVVHVPSKTVTRISFNGHAVYPDLWVSPEQADKKTEEDAKSE